MTCCSVHVEFLQLVRNDMYLFKLFSNIILSWYDCMYICICNNRRHDCVYNSVTMFRRGSKGILPGKPLFFFPGTYRVWLDVASAFLPEPESTVCSAKTPISYDRRTFLSDAIYYYVGVLDIILHFYPQQAVVKVYIMYFVPKCGRGIIILHT